MQQKHNNSCNRLRVRLKLNFVIEFLYLGITKTKKFRK